MLKRVLGFVVLVSLVAIAPAQKIDAKKLDAFLDKRLAEAGVPGAAIGVAIDGKLVYKKAYGFADLEAKRKVETDGVFRIGSITKTFTAVLMMQLIEEGKANLDTKARQILPDLPEAWDAITIRQLLNHTSGIFSYTSMPNFDAELAFRPITPRVILDVVKDKPLDFAPGMDWNYSNTGYILLGLLIEKLAAAPYAEVLQKRILQPLRMNSTFFTTDDRLVDKRVRGYSQGKNGLENAAYLNMVWPYSAGSMESTIEDLVKWNDGLAKSRLVTKATSEMMFSPTMVSGKPEGYGLGMMIKEINGQTILGHGGGINGFVCFMGRVVEKKLTVVVLTNGDFINVEALFSDVLGEVDPSLKVKPIEKETDKNPEFTKEDRATFEALINGTLKDEQLTPEFAKQFSPQVRETASAQARTLGEIKEFVLVKSISDSPARTREYQVKFKDVVMLVRISRTPDGKIAGIGARVP